MSKEKTFVRVNADFVPDNQGGHLEINGDIWVRQPSSPAGCRCRELREALEAIRDYEPTEIVYDEFAYKRMVESYRKAARKALAAHAEGGGE